MNFGKLRAQLDNSRCIFYFLCLSFTFCFRSMAFHRHLKDFYFIHLWLTAECVFNFAWTFSFTFALVVKYAWASERLSDWDIHLFVPQLPFSLHKECNIHMDLILDNSYVCAGALCTLCVRRPLNIYIFALIILRVSSRNRFSPHAQFNTQNESEWVYRKRFCFCGSKLFIYFLSHLEILVFFFLRGHRLFSYYLDRL